MEINSDISKRVVIRQEDLSWAEEPCGIGRRCLEQGSTRATSVIRLAPGSSLEADGEFGHEILVLEGAIECASDVCLRGDYLKDPSSRKYSSGSGATLFFKSYHVDQGEVQRILVRTSDRPWYQGLVDGLSVMPLSESGTKHTALVRWDPGTRFNPHRHFGGEEIYVLEGVFADEFGKYPKGTWMRSPHLSAHCPYSTEGCTILVKTGHLLD